MSSGSTSSLPSEPLFEVGRMYRRSTLHDRFGGQRQGGISTPAKYPLIFLFTGEAGEPFGYTDWWDDERTFRYYGEGQRGDMAFRAGNAAIRDHLRRKKRLYLFQATRKSRMVRYLGEVAYLDWDVRKSTDVAKSVRDAIVFRLQITDGN